MTPHGCLDRHLTDLVTRRGPDGRLFSRCMICGQSMIKLPGLPWRASDKPA